MRRKRENQLPLSGLWPGHRLAQELKAVSKILDDNPSILGLVLHDLCDTAGSGQGAPGLSAEQVLRAAILKNWHQLPYTKLAFLLSDSQSFRRFARLPWQWTPQCLLPPGQHQPDSSRNLAADQPAPGAMGGGPGTGTGTEDPSRCHGRGKPHPLSAGFPDVVRLGSSPHPLAAPLGPTSQDRLFGSPAPGQATLLRTSPTTGASVVCEPIGIC